MADAFDTFQDDKRVEKLNWDDRGHQLVAETKIGTYVITKSSKYIQFLVKGKLAYEHIGKCKSVEQCKKRAREHYNENAPPSL